MSTRKVYLVRFVTPSVCLYATREYELQGIRACKLGRLQLPWPSQRVASGVYWQPVHPRYLPRKVAGVHVGMVVVVVVVSCVPFSQKMRRFFFSNK